MFEETEQFPSKFLIFYDTMQSASTLFLLAFDPLIGDARHLRQECYTSQRLRSERDSNLTYIMRADHEFYCSNTAPINHKVNGDVST